MNSTVSKKELVYFHGGNANFVYHMEDVLAVYNEAL